MDRLGGYWEESDPESLSTEKSSEKRFPLFFHNKTREAGMLTDLETKKS